MVQPLKHIQNVYAAMLLLQQITIVIKIERHIYVLKDNTFIQSRPVYTQSVTRDFGRSR